MSKYRFLVYGVLVIGVLATGEWFLTESLTSVATTAACLVVILCLLIMNRTIADCKRTEKDLREREASLATISARLNGIITSAMDAIISIDSNQRVILFNPAAEKMFGTSSQDALGQSIDRFIPQRFRKAHTTQVRDFAKTGVSNRRMGALGSVSGLRANGEEFFVEASISQIEHKGEKIFTVILRDITQRRRSEDRLREAQEQLTLINRNLESTVQERTAHLQETVADLDAFCYSLSHDMRAPLRAIESYAQIVLEDYGTAIEAHGRDYLDKVISSANRLDRLILDVLAFSRVGHGNVALEPMDIEKLIREIIQERPELQSDKADIEIEHPLLQVLGHEASLTQCITNLLANAVKFVSTGVKPRVRIWTEAKGDFIRLWFEDNGIGIESDALGKLFGIFERSAGAGAYTGTGMGLAIVRKAATRMGGQVGVESVPGAGSRFWLQLKRPGGTQTDHIYG